MPLHIRLRFFQRTMASVRNSRLGLTPAELAQRKQGSGDHISHSRGTHELRPVRAVCGCQARRHASLLVHSVKGRRSAKEKGMEVSMTSSEILVFCILVIACV